MAISLTLPLGICVYRNRWYITHFRVVARAMTGSAKQIKMDQQSRYDSFISYDVKNDANSLWVMHHLIPEIELGVDRIDFAEELHEIVRLLDRLQRLARLGLDAPLHLGRLPCDPLGRRPDSDERGAREMLDELFAIVLPRGRLVDSAVRGRNRKPGEVFHRLPNPLLLGEGNVLGMKFFERS